MGGAQMACPPVRARLALQRSGGQRRPQTASPRCRNLAARAGWLPDAGTEQRNLPENPRIRLESVLVLRLMGSDSLVVKHATSISGGETPIDCEFGAIGPSVPGAGALAQLGKRRHPLPPQALSRPQAGFQFGRIKPAPVLGSVVHRESPPQPVSRLRTEGGGKRLFPMGVEIVQHQMNGGRGAVTARDPFERSRELRRGTIFCGVSLMATGFWLDHAEHIGRAAARVLVVAAHGPAWHHRGGRPQRVQQLHRPLVQRQHRRMLIPRSVQYFQHRFHPLQVLLVELRHAPHFFPATASARGLQTDGGWSPAPPCAPPRAAGLVPPSAPRSSARVRGAAGRTPSPRSQPAAWYPTAWAAWGAGHRSAPSPNPAPDTASRLGAPRADRCRPRLPSGSVSTLGPIVPGSVSAASAVHLTAARRRAPRAAFGAPSPSAAIPGTSLAAASSAPRLLFDQIHRPSASHLAIPVRGSEH